MNAKVRSVMSQSLKSTTKMASNITKTKHKKLDEDWFESREPIRDGMRFNAKYLGLTLVDEAKGDVMSLAVQRIVTMARGAKKRLVQLMVSSQGIKVLDHSSSLLISEIRIQRISFCAALKNHMKVFAFVALNEKDDTMECHAYLCNTAKEAQTLTMTVAQSFKVAYEINEENTSKESTDGETDDSNLKALDGEKNVAPVTVPNMTEKRYQRFSTDSNPFERSDHETNQASVMSSDDKNIVKLEEKHEEVNSANDIGNVFLFTTPLPTPTTSSSTSKPDTPITPLRPPPSSTRQSEKSSSRRPLARPTSVGSPLPNSAILYQAVQTPSPSQSTPDVEDWDQGFADLALSRTQEKSSPVEEKKVEAPTKMTYPPSNPFFSPSNPFLT